MSKNLVKVLFYIVIAVSFSYAQRDEVSDHVLSDHAPSVRSISERVVSERLITTHSVADHSVAERTVFQRNLSRYLQSQSNLDIRNLNVQIVDIGDAFTLVSQLDINWPEVAGKFMVGTSVIVVTGTVYFAASAAGLEPVAFVAAASFKGAVKEAAYGTAIGGALGALEGKFTGKGDEKTILKHFIEGAVDGYMWGALIGAATGGRAGYKELVHAEKAIETAAEVVPTVERGVTRTLLSEAERIAIQQATGWPMKIVEKIKTLEQFEILKNAGLEYMVVNGRPALCKKIDPDFIAPKTRTVNHPNGQTNKELMKNGKAPFDPITGEKIELHHLNQEFEGVFVELTNLEHGASPNHGILHPIKESFRRDPTKKELYEKTQRPGHWIARGSQF